MRVWIDITNSPHVVIFRPIIARMRARGHEVTVTAREFAQTIGLLERFGIEHVSVGAHGGASRAGKARAMARRSAELVRFARAGRFDLAVAHGSTDQPPAARLAGTPQVTMFDYEYAAAMHHWNGRFASRVLVPSAIPETALARYGMRPPRLVRYPGLKEEYYLADHAIDDAVVDELALDRGRLLAVVRPPPEVTLYHRGASTDLFAGSSRACWRRRGCRPWCCPARRSSAPPSRGSGDRARASGRRAEPGGRRRPGGERRGHDEPGGRGPRGAGLHALRRPARRGRPEPHRRGAGSGAWSARRTSSWSPASGAPGRPCATPRSWST